MNHKENFGLRSVDPTANRCGCCGNNLPRQTAEISALLHEAIDAMKRLQSAMPSGRRHEYHTTPFIQPRPGESWQDAMDTPGTTVPWE